MKNTRSHVLAIFVAMVLALTSIASVYSFAGDEDISVPTKKELKVLLKTAKESPEHRRIAAYYRQEALRLRKDAKEHSDLAAIYANRLPYIANEAKRGDTVQQGASHCKKFAALAEEQAKEADALSSLHEDMAQAAEQK